MNHQPFQKCACQNCGDSIEFPAQGVGLSIDCPHCNQRTLLTGNVESPLPETSEETPSAPPVPRPVPEPLSESKKTKTFAVIGTLLVLGVLAGVATWYFKAGPGRRRSESASLALPRDPSSPPSSAANAEVLPKGTTNTGTATKAEKSLDDLKPGPVTLEKAKFGSLVYAVGKLKNDSAHQRFGVKIEIECKDAKGRPAGKASDYTQVIEPGQEWRFQALVLDSKATTGSVVDLQEDN